LNTSADIALAEQHDAAGRHDDAINALARATKRGEIEAMTRLGKRLLAGDRAPHLPADGARFLIDAAAGGGAEAAEQLAALAGLGAHVEQSWNDALELLGMAAERGRTSARGQLRALARDAESTELRGDLCDWRRTARGIDVAAWVAAPAGQTLHALPVVRRVPQLAPAGVCRWLIRRASGKLAPARVYDAFAGRDTTHSLRTNSSASFTLAEIDLVQALLQARMAAACGLPPTHFEAPAILHYDVGEQISDHYDFVDPRSPHFAEQVEQKGQRAITFLMYLNDDYDGGETAFPKLGIEHKGTRGEGLFFVNVKPTREPDLDMVHAGRPPTHGEKWIVSQFIRDRQVLPRDLF
jgi:prolyl 4-hydroxylase